MIGELQMAKGILEEAVAAFDKAVELSPELEVKSNTIRLQYAIQHY